LDFQKGQVVNPGDEILPLKVHGMCKAGSQEHPPGRRWPTDLETPFVSLSSANRWRLLLMRPLTKSSTMSLELFMNGNVGRRLSL
jgi:hypothetical protein